MKGLASRVAGRFESQLGPDEDVLHAALAHRGGLQLTLSGVQIAIVPALAGAVLARVCLDSDNTLGVIVGLLLLAFGLASIGRALWAGQSRRAAVPGTAGRLPKHVLVALTTQRLWLCSFRGGLVATPKAVLADIPVDSIAEVSPISGRTVRVRRSDGTTFEWDFIPKCAADGQRLVDDLRQLLEPAGAPGRL